LKKSTSPAFETILVMDGKAQNIEYHQARFERTQRELFGTSADMKLSDRIVAPGTGIYRCKVVYDLEILSCDTLPYEKKPISKLKIVDSDIDYTYKTVDRSSLEELFAKRGDADDVIIARDGLITDTTIANLAFFDGTHWLTPANPLLKGTTRQRLLDDKSIQESNITIDALKNFTAVALMNALRGFDIVGDCNSSISLG